MPDILLRGISEEDAATLDLKAKAAGKDRMHWLVDRLHEMAVTPSQYAYRVYGVSGGAGTIRRYSDHPNGTSPTFSNFNQDEADAMEQASNFIRRNAPGDKEKAFNVLVGQFGEDQVFEIPA